MKQLPVTVSQTKLEEFCKHHHIRRLALFGSVLRDDFRPDSDIDVLVEFEPGHVPGLFGLEGIALELVPLLGGRAVDLNTSRSLSHYIRDRVLQQAEVLYERAG